MVDSDGKTHLDKPYCALQKECFGGIVGAKSPYADGLGLIGELKQDSSNKWKFFPKIIQKKTKQKYKLRNGHFLCELIERF